MNLEDFLKQIDDNFLIKHIVDKTEDYIVDKIIGSYIVRDKLKYFYIAIDGVPYYSKIVEQKKRRYLAPVQIGIQENIFKKHEETLKKIKKNIYMKKIKYIGVQIIYLQVQYLCIKWIKD